MTTIRIDPRIRNHIPPQTDDEFTQLRENIIRNGCLDPLILGRLSQDDTPFLLDGHHRYSICTSEHIPFETKTLEFPSIEDAMNWVIEHQLGRRNITPEQRRYLIGKLYQKEKKSQGGTGANQYVEQSSQNANSANNKPPAKTATVIGERFGVSKDSVIRAAKFADAVDTIADTYGEGAKAAILSGSTKLPQKAITEAAKQLYSNESPDWHVPAAIVDAVVTLFTEIDLDPCSNAYGAEANVPAKHHFTAADDGLSRDWNGKIVLKTPYGREIGKWTARLKHEISNGHISEAVVMIPAQVDTRWFNDVGKEGYLWCAVEGGPAPETKTAPFPYAIFYIGSRLDEFYHIFKRFGPIYRSLDDMEMSI